MFEVSMTPVYNGVLTLAEPGDRTVTVTVRELLGFLVNQADPEAVSAFIAKKKEEVSV